MDSLGSLMLGSEVALETYMTEKPRRRDESIVSKSMAIQVLVMGLWLTGLSFFYLTTDWIRGLFETDEQLYISYFVFFIVAALFNAFNVRANDTKIFAGLGENKTFLPVFFAIIGIQALIINL